MALVLQVEQRMQEAPLPLLHENTQQVEQVTAEPAEETLLQIWVVVVEDVQQALLTKHTTVVMAVLVT
jgi:hypothetical protein